MPRGDRGGTSKGTGVRCVAANCGNTSADGVSLHYFPRNPTRRKRWTDFVQVKRVWSGPTQYSALCSVHFPEECIPFKYKFQMEHMGTKPKGIHLTDDAIPTIHVETCKTPSPAQDSARQMPKLSLLSPLETSASQSSPPKKLKRGYLKREAARIVAAHEKDKLSQKEREQCQGAMQLEQELDVNTAPRASVSCQIKPEEAQKKCQTKKKLATQGKLVCEGRRSRKVLVSLMLPKRRREENDEATSSPFAKQIKREDGDTGPDDMGQTSSTPLVPSPVVQTNLKLEQAKEENVALVQREKNLSAVEELGKSGDGPSLKIFQISNETFEVKIEPRTGDGGNSTSFRNIKANSKEEDQTEIKAEPEIQDDMYVSSKKEDLTELKTKPEIESEIEDDLYVRLSNTGDNSKEKAAQILTSDGKTEKAFQIDNQPITIKTEPETKEYNQPITIKTEPETQDNGDDVSKDRKPKNEEKAVVNRTADGHNLSEQSLQVHNQPFMIKTEVETDNCVSVSSNNRNAKSRAKTVQESMIPRPVDDYTQSKQVIVIGNESFTITINPEFEEDIHCASSANEKARSEENVSQKFTVPSSMDGYTRQGQCVQPIIFKTEPEVPFDVSISSATKKANIKEESAQAMTETGLEDSGTQLKPYLHIHSQAVTIKTEPDTWEEVTEHSVERKDNNDVQTAQILRDTRPRDSYTPLEHHQPFIIKTEPETWDHIPVCSTKKTERNKEKYAQETTVANTVGKIQQIHQIQNQSLIIKSEPVTGDDFLESCVNMEAKSTDKTEQELKTTGLVDNYTQLEQVSQLPSQTFKIKTEPESEHVHPVNVFLEEDRKSVSAVSERMSSEVKVEQEEETEIKNEYNFDASDRKCGEPDKDSVTDDSDISHGELDSDYLTDITDNVVKNLMEEFEVKPKPAYNRQAKDKGRKYTTMDSPAEVLSFEMLYDLMITQPSEKKKKQGKESTEEHEKPKQKRISAYLLWVKVNRPKVAAEFHPSDFSAISKKLGKLWSPIPRKEKLWWKRMALRITRRESQMLAEGKAVVPANTCTESKLKAEENAAVSANTRRRSKLKAKRNSAAPADTKSKSIAEGNSMVPAYTCTESKLKAEENSVAQDVTQPAREIVEATKKGEDSSKPFKPERKAKRHKDNDEPKKSSSEEALKKNEVSSKPVTDERKTKQLRGDGEPTEPGPEEIQFEIDREYLGEDFIQKEVVIDSHRHIICASDDQIRILKNSRTWFVDRTFKFIRRPFVQLWTIHSFIKRGRDIQHRPLAFVLMTRTKTEDYIQVLEALRTLAPLSLQAVVMDFESAAWTAFRCVFPEIRIHGCLFHWVKCLWRKVKELELQTPYRECRDVYVFIRRLMALPFLPHEHIGLAFENLKQAIISPQLVILCAYLEETWFKSAVFSPESVSVYMMGLRTNNDLEGWQRQLKIKSRGRTLGFYPLIEQLRRGTDFAEKCVPITNEILYIRHTRRRYHPIQTDLDKLWGKYADRQMSIVQFLVKTSELFGEFH